MAGVLFHAGLNTAPLPSPGLPFVDAVDEEGQDVGADKVDDEVSHGVNYAEKCEFN